jgi:RNA polymerase sigma-70 factor (ECF subfamily)
MPEFERLLAAAKGGDEASFSALFRALQPRLLRYLRTVAPGLADDVASDTWLSVVRGLDRFSGDEPGWTAWVFTIARARMVDAQRRAVRTPIPYDVDVALDSWPAPDDVDAAVEETLSTEAALALIRRLPRQQAEVVLLRHIVGLGVEHTAQVLGKRPGAVRVAAHRGLNQLAAMLPDHAAVRGTRSNESGSVRG